MYLLIAERASLMRTQSRGQQWGKAYIILFPYDIKAGVDSF